MVLESNIIYESSDGEKKINYIFYDDYFIITQPKGLFNKKIIKYGPIFYTNIKTVEFCTSSINLVSTTEIVIYFNDGSKKISFNINQFGDGKVKIFYDLIQSQRIKKFNSK